jgi:hypothetical protein
MADNHPPAAVQPSPIALSVGREHLTLPASSAALQAAIEKANEAARLDGLPDAMNLGIIDQEKAAHFVAALPSLPKRTTARLAKLGLRFGGAGLGIQLAEPTHPTDFDRPFELVFDSVKGESVSPRITLAPDVELARSRAIDAEAAFGAADKAVRALDADRGSQSPDDVMNAKWRRAEIAKVWRLNAQAWAQSRPADLAAKGAFENAEVALQDSQMPSRAGLFGP